MGADDVWRVEIVHEERRVEGAKGLGISISVDGKGWRVSPRGQRSTASKATQVVKQRGTRHLKCELVMIVKESPIPGINSGGRVAVPRLVVEVGWRHITVGLLPWARTHQITAQKVLLAVLSLSATSLTEQIWFSSRFVITLSITVLSPPLSYWSLNRRITVTV